MKPNPKDDLLERAWAIMANATDWGRDDYEGSPLWILAAEKWRDEYFNLLDEEKSADGTSEES